MTGIRNIGGIAAMLAALAAAAPATTWAEGVSDGVVRIGIMNDQSGPYATNGGPGSIIAARMAIEDFGGKVLGKPIELLVTDDQNKPDLGVTQARQWLDTANIDTIVGGSTSTIALAVQALLTEREKPYLIAGTGAATLTGEACSPLAINFIYDTYALPRATTQALVAQGKDSFFFITVDYAFGLQMQQDATRFIEAAGGKVIGSVKHPLGATDYSAYLVQAQASGAKVIMIANAGADLSNTLKQAGEFAVTASGQTLASTGATVNSIIAVGLDAAQGLTLTVPFDWNQNDETRAWSARFMERYGKGVPTYIHSGTYSAITHYLKAIEAAGTDDGPAVVARMKETPINSFEMKDVRIREDGVTMRPMYLVQVKTPAQSSGPNDVYNYLATIAPEDAWRPMSEGGCPFVTKPN